MLELLRAVVDPELGADIVSLGMVPAVEVGDEGDVTVEIRLTIGGCPLRGQIQKDVKSRVAVHPGVRDVRIQWGEMTPEERSDRAGAARFVRAFLDTLPADRRELFTLVDVEGLSVRAAAEHLGVNVNTAHARLRAARSAFREAVRERDRSAPARSARS